MGLGLIASHSHYDSQRIGMLPKHAYYPKLELHHENHIQRDRAVL